MTFKPFEIIGADRPSRWLVTCDHASNIVPPDVSGGILGICDADMNRHIAAASEQRDPENKLYTRMLRRRLDWESWRDAILSATGQIDLKIGGPASSISAAENHRRSLYGASDRQDMDPMLRIHDVPDPGAHNPWRTETMTPLQGLFALNSPFMQQQSEVLGKWAMEHRVEDIYARLFGRKPSAHEAEVARAFLSSREKDPAAWAQYAQALLAGNEMLFVD